MQHIRNIIWNIIQEYLFRPTTLERITDAIVPLVHERAISYLTKGFDIHIMDVLRPKVGPKEEYVIYESTHPATLWFLLDLADAREGDKFDIKLYVRQSNGDFLLRDHWELEDQREMPMVTLSSQFAPACRLVVAQVRGLSKEIRYEVFGRCEGR